MSRAIRLLGLLLLVPALAARGETAYVIDRLLVGVHEDKTPDSAIIKVLPTGTALEVLERDGDVARVAAADGTTGWVDSSYLMLDKPAQLVLGEMIERQREAEAALSQARAELAALRQGGEGPNDAPPGAEPAIDSDSLREMQRLAEEIGYLKDKLVDAEARAEALEQAARAPEPAAPASALASVLAIPGWQWAVLGLALLLGLALGGWWVDYGVRKRHGGFRI